MDKKQLYESIMKNVAKEVKRTLNESKQSFDDVAESKENIFNELAENNDKSAFMNEAFNEVSYFMEMFKKSNEKEYLFTAFKIMDELRDIFYTNGVEDDKWSKQYGFLLSVIKDGYAFQYVGNKLPLLAQRRLRRPFNN